MGGSTTVRAPLSHPAAFVDVATIAAPRSGRVHFLVGVGEVAGRVLDDARRRLLSRTVCAAVC